MSHAFRSWSGARALIAAVFSLPVVARPAALPGEGAGAPSSARAGGASPHNVLVIVLDDVGVDLIGAYEQHFRSLGRAPGAPAETPGIDALLCAQGVSFTQAWTSPMCTPSRAQILTGLHSSRTGLGAVLRPQPIGNQPNPGLSMDHVLLSEVLAASHGNHSCAALGKWHLADIDQLAVDLAHPLGSPRGRWFGQFAGSAMNLERASSAPSGLNLFFGWRKTYAAPIRLGSDPCGPAGYPCVVDVVAPPVTSYATADTTEDALALMANLPQPWFLYVAYNAPHAPPHVAPLSLPKPMCPEYPPQLTPCVYDRASSFAQRVRCMLRVLDEQIARLLCAHDPQTTTVILIGDNGTDSDATLPPFLSAHAKGQVYEGGVQVPLIVRSPLIPPALRGSFDASLVCSTDIFATVSELTGGAAATPDSVSFAPLLTGQASGSLRSYAYTEGFFPNFTPQTPGGGAPPNYVGGVHNQAVREARFKLIRRSKRIGSSATVLVTEELYDLTQGGPPDVSVHPPRPTPDWFEERDLLSSGAPPSPEALAAYGRLSNWLDANFPSLTR